MKIDYRIGSYRASGDHDPVLMKKLGWNWFPTAGEWRTAHIANVIPLEAFCVGEAAIRVHPVVADRRFKIAASNAATADVVIPVGKRAREAGKDFRGYQKAGIVYTVPRERSLIGDIPRLGKMIQGIGRVNLLAPGSWERGLIISPANAKITWCERWEEWSTHEHSVDYCEGDHNPDSWVTVCNWELVARHAADFARQPWDWIIFDEIHRCGGEKSATTQITIGPDSELHAKLFYLGLSGTPIGTRPINFWPICRFMDPHGLGADKWYFRKRYCGATKENRFDSKGSTNEEELQFKARAAFMVRRDMADVGADLPPNRQTVRLPAAGLSRLIRAERSAMQDRLAEYQVNIHAGSSGLSAAELAEQDEANDPEKMAVRDLTLAALPMMIEFVNDQLETEEKVVVFCHHRDVAKELQKAFTGCAFVIGGLTVNKREAERKRFQDDPECRVFVGNIAACCENLELAASNVIVFCEYIWQTGLLDQAEMRIWLPTKSVPIQIFRLVVAGSATADMADEMERRQQGIERATVAKHLLAA